MGVPTYEDIKRQKIEANRQQTANAQLAQSTANTNQELEAVKNPVLQQYMNREAAKAGLGDPRTAPTPASYSEQMMNGVLAGQVDPRELLADANVLPEYKDALMQQMQPQRTPGLGSIPLQ